MSNPDSPFEKDRGRTRSSRKRLTEYATTLPESPPLLNSGNRNGSDDSNSEHSFISYNSSPCQEVLCEFPKQYQPAFQCSSPVGSYGPQAFPRTGFYQNSRHQSSPIFHKAYYNEEVVYAPHLDLARSYYAQHAPSPSSRYEYWSKDAAVPHNRGQRPLPPDPRISPSPARRDYPQYRTGGLSQQEVSEQLKSWHLRRQLTAPRSRSLDRQGAVRLKNMQAQEVTYYQSQKYNEQVSIRW